MCHFKRGSLLQYKLMVAVIVRSFHGIKFVTVATYQLTKLHTEDWGTHNSYFRSPSCFIIPIAVYM